MDRWVAALERPESYRDPHDERAPLGHVQTHLSHVFLGPKRVYKLRKPVRFGFVDFSTSALRAADCAREVELNRRLAPSVYLGVARIDVGEGDRVEVGPVQERPDDDAVEWLVVMRRLPDGGDLQSRLERGDLGRDELADVAGQLAAFHAAHRLAVDASPTADAWFDSVLHPVMASFDELAMLASGFDLKGFRREVERRAADLETLFVARRREGRAVEGHGDLRLEHLWRDEAGRIQVIDCVEFDAGLRRIDAVSDLAFLSMDLRHRQHPALAEHLLASYADRSDDWQGFEVVDFFEAYRALVRAKVAHLRARDADVPAEARREAEASVEAHLALAAGVLTHEPARLAVLVCGPIGSGKSTAARALCARLAAVPIASDRVREHIVEARPDARWQGGGYGDAAKDAVYRGLLARAEHVRAGGRVVVLDASFSKARWRAAAAEWAHRNGLRLMLVETTCEPALVKARVAERQRRGDDASQAGPELVDASRAEWEQIDGWPEADRVRIDMGSDGWQAEIDAVASRLVG